MKLSYLSCALLLIVVLSLGRPLSIYGQGYSQRSDFVKANSVWAFGEGGGLDFNIGGGVPFRSAQFSDEGCASVADPVTGKLLFYSNGGVCRNANDMVMPNGNGLLGNPSRGPGVIEYSTTQGVCIAPVIHTAGQYYLFSLSGSTSGGPRSTGSLFYNIVDVNLDQGRGDIIVGMKNLTLDRDSLSEAMIVIPGNNCDLWLLVHSLHQPLFKAYHITYKGIDTNAVESVTGQEIDRYKIGSLCVSPDRTKIAITDAINGTLVARFDPNNGRVSDALKIHDGLDYGVCFSPDNSKLYISETRSLHQFDLTRFNANAISNSRVQIATLTQKPLYGLRLYRDTVYMVVDEGTALHRINSPNLAGASCGFQLAAVHLSPGTVSRFSLGNDVVFPNAGDTINSLVLDTMVCGKAITLRVRDNATNFVWDDGSLGPERSVERARTYWVSGNDFCHSWVDSFIISGLNFEPPTVAISVHTLRTTLAYASYQWLRNDVPIPGATQRYYEVVQNGSHRVLVNDSAGCEAISDAYDVTNFDVGIDDVVTEGFAVFPVPTRDRIFVDAPVGSQYEIWNLEGRKIRFGQAIESITLIGAIPGVYVLQLYDRYLRPIWREKIILLP